MADKEVFDFDQIKMPNVSPNLIKYGVIGIFVLIFIFSAFFTISPEEVGVILRFGKFSHIADPGLNFKLPLGIDNLYKVSVQRQQKEEFGFRTEAVGVRSRYSKASFLDESLMLTGDLNSAEVEWIVQFRISDPYKFLFKVRET
ncbi:MAG: FtsH protease activity modulator HflK, partial [Calditrichia bacterium]|nr:FtsH protease activity modulator HflK [Calditrichia bacterium]